MTIMAVTAIICASTSEAAFLVASVMPFSLDSGLGEPGFLDAIHRCPQRLDDHWIYSEHPSTSIRFD